jgi:hypothetical protein
MLKPTMVGLLEDWELSDVTLRVDVFAVGALVNVWPVNVWTALGTWVVGNEDVDVNLLSNSVTVCIDALLQGTTVVRSDVDVPSVPLDTVTVWVMVLLQNAESIGDEEGAWVVESGTVGPLGVLRADVDALVDMSLRIVPIVDHDRLVKVVHVYGVDRSVVVTDDEVPSPLLPVWCETVEVFKCVEECEVEMVGSTVMVAFECVYGCVFGRVKVTAVEAFGCMDECGVDVVRSTVAEVFEGTGGDVVAGVRVTVYVTLPKSWIETDGE